MKTTKFSKPAPNAYRELTDDQRRKLFKLRYTLAKGRAMLKARMAEMEAA